MRHPLLRILTACLFLSTQVHAADLTLLTAGAFKSIAADLTPAFESTAGAKVTIRNDTAGALLRRIKANETFDVVIMPPSGLHDLILAGKLAPNSEITLAKVGIGVGVKTGAPKPDITTVAAFKATMLQARAVATIDPASGGSSGIYLANLFRILGIAEAMAPKSVLIHGGFAAEAVTDGRADIVAQQISEILAVPGVTLVGPLPADIQNETIYAGAIAANATAPDVAHAFLAFLAGPAARPVLAAKGMMPP